MRICFEIDELPKTTNAQSSMHWRQKHQHTKRWQDLVKLQLARHRPSAALPRAKLTLTRFSSVEPDYDGLVSSFKCVIDALIVHGVLANDKVSNIGQSEYRWQRCPPKRGKIQVVVEEAGYPAP